MPTTDMILEKKTTLTGTFKGKIKFVNSIECGINQKKAATDKIEKILSLHTTI